MGIGDVHGISWTSAPRSRQITTPIPYLSILYRPDALSDAQPTVSRHRRHTVYKKTGHETSSLNSKYTVRQKKRNHFSFMNILLCNVIWQNLVLLLLWILSWNYLFNFWNLTNFHTFLCKKCDVGYYVINHGFYRRISYYVIIQSSNEIDDYRWCL